jgi:hypothetical protein
MAKQQSNYLKVASQSRNFSEGTDRLPLSWGAYWTRKIDDYEVPGVLLRLPPVMAMLTDSMSYIFTAIHCIQQLHSSRGQDNSKSTETSNNTLKKTLCIHFIGADVLDVFGAQAGVFEEILHWFPAVTHLELVLIGPDMQADREGERRLINDTMCVPCREKQCSVFLTCIQAKYHDAIEQKKLSTEFLPDIAMLCNSGLHEQTSYSSSLANMWAPTLELLYDQHTPLAATSYTAEEAQEDWLQMMTVLEERREESDDSNVDSRSRDKLIQQLVIPPSRNPFRGLLPMPDTLSDNNFFYNNNFYFVLKSE